MQDNKEMKAIDLREIFQTIWKQRKLFAKVLPVVFILSCLYIICIPRTYSSDTTLAPELDNPMSGGTLGDIASTLGFNLSDMQTNDAITPLLYPDLMDDNQFVADLLSIQVKSMDGEIDCSYEDYLKLHQKKPWWGYMFDWMKSFLPKGEDPNKDAQIKGLENSPYLLTKDKDGIMEMVRSNISMRVDKKTGIITIKTTAQDALICKALADSACTHLQTFITAYRTKKAIIDKDYYLQLTNEARKAYDKARVAYSSYADSHQEVYLQSAKTKLDDLENDMQLKFNNYTAMTTQYQAALARVQERTPAFTMIKGATIPYKPTGPKRMFFVAGMLIFATILLSLYVTIKKK